MTHGHAVTDSMYMENATIKFIFSHKNFSCKRTVFLYDNINFAI